MKIIDLSVPLSEDTPVYPGDPKTVVKPAGNFKNDGFRDHFVSLSTHVGTHIDAPMHMIKTGKSLNEIPVQRFIGKGVLVDCSDGDFGKVKSQPLGKGDIVLFFTGLDQKYYQPEYFTVYPAMDEETADFLVNSGVSVVGVDACSVDNKDEFPIHKKLLAGDVYIIENLTGLGRLKGKKFRVYALPIKLQIDGAPARVIAEVEK